MKGIALWILVAATSCGGSSMQVLDTGDGGPDSKAGAPACGEENVASVVGTWDLIASNGTGQSNTGTLTIDASTFIFSAGERSLAFRANGSALTLTWADGPKNVPINVSHTATPVDVGLEPIAAGGSWIFSSTTSSESCSATLGSDAFTATCADVHSTPFGTLNGTLNAQRSQKAQSIFGELGGTWHVAGSGGGGVDATFSGNTFTASLFGSAGSGTMTLRVCNGVASGSTSAGFEISAQRR
jgi:hypothetical protein